MAIIIIMLAVVLLHLAVWCAVSTSTHVVVATRSLDKFLYVFFRGKTKTGKGGTVKKSK